MGHDKKEKHPENSPEPGSNGHPYFSEYKAGVRDEFLGVTVEKVLYKTEKHIVFLDDSTNLHWDCATKTEVRRCYPEVANRVASLEARSEFLRRVNSNGFLRRPRSPQDPRTQEDLTDLTNARLLISLAIIQMLVEPKNQDRAKYADTVLDTAEAWILQRATETSRVWYFHPFGIFFGISFICLLLFLIFDHHHLHRSLPYACIAAGGIGAFISSAIGNVRIPCAASAGRKLHTLEAAMRWSVGLIAGLLIYVFSQSNYGAPFLTGADPKQVPFAVLAVALLAGASERFLPSLIKKLDDPAITMPDKTAKT